MIAKRRVSRLTSLWMRFLFMTTLGFLSAHSEAQNINAGEIRGVVTDSTGAAVSNAAVSLMNTDTGVITKVTADASGVYDVPQLTPGSYNVSISAPAFKTYVESNVLLRTAPIQVNAILQVGTVGEQVTVNADNQVELQTEDSESNLTLDSTTVTSIPNIGNTWFNETVLIPGVNGGGKQNQNGESIGVDGAQPYQENFLLNGGIETFIGSQNPDWIIEPTDFIAETQFETHNFNATSGGGLAVLNIITKNGTNKWHGSFWDYNTNSAFAAQNYFSGGSGVPPSSQNTFGVTASGPIIKDKLFFFAGEQRQLLNAGATGIGSVPTAAMKAGDFSELDPATGKPIFSTIFNPATTATAGGVTTRQPFAGNQIPAGSISQQAANWQKFFPDPNYGATGAIIDNYRYSEQVHDVTDWYTGKIDYNLSSKHHVNASGVYGDVTFPNPSLLNPIGEFAEHGHEFQTTVSETWTPSSTLINEARFSVVRFFGYWVSGDYGQGYATKIGIPGTFVDAWPSLNVTGGYSYGAGLEANISENEYVPSDVVTWVKGKHILKFGGEFDAGQVNGNFSGYSDGSFSFNGDSTRDPQGSSNGVGYADFLLGDVSNWSISITPEAGGRLKTPMFFAQDDYKVRPNLTLNLGFRYEIQPGWGEAQDRQGDFDPTLLNPATGTLGAVWFAKGANGVNSRIKIEQTSYIPQPRVGFSWQPRKNWTVRAGYGIYAELLGQNTYEGDEVLGISGTNSLNETDSLTPVFTLARGSPQPIFTTVANLTPSSLNGQSVGYTPHNTKVPTIEEFQLDTQHEFAKGIVADLAYVGTVGRHLALTMDWNQVPANELGSSNPAQFRPFPQFQSLPTTIGEGNSSYNALQARLQKQFAAGWQFSTAFTYSHTLDEGTGTGNGGAAALGDVWQNGYNLKADYGNSLLDQRLSFNGDIIYDLPVGQGKMFLNQGGVLNAVLGGWRVAGLWQLHTGVPFTPILENNLTGSLAGTWFPDRVGSGKLSHHTLNEWFDPTAFKQPAIGTYGNSGRNILYGPGWQQLDLSMQKHWAVPFFFGEKSDVQVRVDTSDLTNNPNFGQPNPNLVLVPGTTTGALMSPGQQITTSNTSRALQFEGKFSF
jgi:hypothetical protein